MTYVVLATIEHGGEGHQESIEPAAGD
jgi:hypothetical protein